MVVPAREKRHPFEEVPYELYLAGKKKKKMGKKVKGNGWRYWWNFWQAIKKSCEEKKLVDVDFADQEGARFWKGPFFISDFIHDFDFWLLELAHRNPKILWKRVEFALEVMLTFPNSREEYIVDINSIVGESYFLLGEEKKAHETFKALMGIWPSNPFCYLEYAKTLLYFGCEKDPKKEEVYKDLMIKALALFQFPPQPLKHSLNNSLEQDLNAGNPI